MLSHDIILIACQPGQKWETLSEGVMAMDHLLLEINFWYLEVGRTMTRMRGYLLILDEERIFSPLGHVYKTKIILSDLQRKSGNWQLTAKSVGAKPDTQYQMVTIVTESVCMPLTPISVTNKYNIKHSEI